MMPSGYIDWIRELVAHLRQGLEVEQAHIEALEDQQDRLAALYEKYQGESTNELSATLSELMMESLQMMHHGIDCLLDYLEEPEDSLLQKGLASLEEGNDVLESLRYALEQDTSWTSGASLG